MANYKESSVTGSQWQRANRVVIENPYNSVPSINFVEEIAVNIGTSIITNQCGNLVTSFDPTSSFPLLDPDTGAETGSTMTHMDIYIALNSLYMYLAGIRDTQEQGTV